MALALAAVGIAVGEDGVGADAPIKVGWWSRWQATTASTLPTGITVPATLPAPPSGEEGGLTVALGPDGVQAVAAMLFQADEGADATLYMKTAKTGGQQKQFALPPGASVAACPALSPWQQQLNGPWHNAPTWRATDCSPGTVTPDGTAMFWTLLASLQDIDGNYDVVLVPTFVPPAAGAPLAPYIVHFAVPGADTFVAEELPEASEETTTTTTVPDETTPDETTTTTDTTTPIETTEETDPIVSYEVGGGRGGGGVPAPVPTTAPAPKEPATLVAFGPPQVAAAPFPLSFPDSRGERIFAVSLLFFMAMALWWLGGSPARMPRLIGALATAGGARPRPLPMPERGIGRFARPRSAAVRPQRL